MTIPLSENREPPTSSRGPPSVPFHLSQARVAALVEHLAGESLPVLGVGAGASGDTMEGKFTGLLCQIS